mgnify:FL=1
MPATAEEISAAQSVILHDVYAPALFNKLAQFGIVPQTEDEAASLVKMARTLNKAAGEQKTAAPVNRFADPTTALDSVLGKQAAADGYREAATQLAMNEEIFKHASLLHAELN